MATNDKGFTCPDGSAADAVIIQRRKVSKNKVEWYESHILLIKRKDDPFKDCWAFPGGFLNPYEDFYEACHREVMEELSMDIGPYCDEKPLCVRSGHYLNDPRGWIIAVPFLVLLPTTIDISFKAGDDAKEAKWFTVKDILEDRIVPLAFDHYDVIDDCVPKHLI